MCTHENGIPVTFDLVADDETYFVLTAALTDWADREEFHAEDDEPLLAADRRRHAGHARKLLEMIEQALDAPPSQT